MRDPIDHLTQRGAGITEYLMATTSIIQKCSLAFGIDKTGFLVEDLTQPVCQKTN
jgi:hypothetical protein